MIKGYISLYLLSLVLVFSFGLVEATKPFVVTFFIRVYDTSLPDFESIEPQYLSSWAAILTTTNSSDITISNVEVFGNGVQVKTQIFVASEAEGLAIQAQIGAVIDDSTYRVTLEDELQSSVSVSLQGNVIVSQTPRDTSGSTSAGDQGKRSGTLSLLATIFVVIAIIVVFVGLIALCVYKL